MSERWHLPQNLGLWAQSLNNLNNSLPLILLVLKPLLFLVVLFLLRLFSNFLLMLQLLIVIIAAISSTIVIIRSGSPDVGLATGSCSLAVRGQLFEKDSVEGRCRILAFRLRELGRRRLRNSSFAQQAESCEAAWASRVLG